MLMKSLNEQEGKQSAHNAHELRDDQNNTGSLNTDVETKTKLERSKETKIKVTKHGRPNKWTRHSEYGGDRKSWRTNETNKNCNKVKLSPICKCQVQKPGS